jgi:hypothetical protein
VNTTFVPCATTYLSSKPFIRVSKCLLAFRKYPEKMSIYVCEECKKPILLNEEKELKIDGVTLHIK